MPEDDQILLVIPHSFHNSYFLDYSCLKETNNVTTAIPKDSASIKMQKIMYSQEFFFFFFFTRCEEDYSLR